MENNDLAAAQKEMVLRGRIIESLLLGNEELRDKNALLVSFIQSKWDTYSIYEKEKLANILGYSIDETGNLSPNVTYAVSETVNGISNVTRGIVEKANGITTNTYSVSETANGISSDTRGIAEKVNGVTNAESNLSEKEDAPKLTTPKFSKAGKPRRSNKGPAGAPDAFYNLTNHIYNGGDCGYPALKRVTGLSTSGLGKMLMRLKKRGVLIRTGLQKLELTPSTIQLLEDSKNRFKNPV